MRTRWAENLVRMGEINSYILAANLRGRYHSEDLGIDGA
jgi:hypothetical protein